MNGWHRLATVLTLPMCTLGFLIGYHGQVTIYETQRLTGALEEQAANGESDQFWSLYWTTANWRTLGQIERCAEGTVRGSLSVYSYGSANVDLQCPVPTSARVWDGLSYAAYPAIAMYILCLAIGWIIAGFRVRPK